MAKQLAVLQIPLISVRYILSVQEFECVPLPAPLLTVTSSPLGCLFPFNRSIDCGWWPLMVPSPWTVTLRP